MSPPARRATYRLQFRPGFGFTDAAAVAGYLADLGVSHLYASPCFQAAPGSTHGYDVVDPTRVSDELGGPGGHAVMLAALREAGLALLLDIVPNHMSTAGRANPWWWETLRDGPSSPDAIIFDIAWEPPAGGGPPQVLLPVLSDHLGRLLEDGELKLLRDGEDIVVAWHEHRAPLCITSVAEIADSVAARRSLAPLADWAAQVAELPPDGEPRHQGRRQLLRNFLELCAHPEVGVALDEELEAIAADPARFDALLLQQHFRLARWQIGVDQINYRRFFDITTLVAVRVELADVFALTHQLAVGMVDAGDADGLRIDHIDGLRHPHRYARLLRAAVGEAAWLPVEKILEGEEQLPDWPVSGTTGYDFAALVNGLLVAPEGLNALRLLWRDISGDEHDYAQTAAACKQLILETTLVADLDRLTGLAASVCAAYPAHRDHSAAELGGALRALISELPVYRTYVDPEDSSTPSAADVAAVETALRRAREHASVDAGLLDFLCDLWLRRAGGELHSSETAGADVAEVELIARLQQLCAAATAKGGEDTAHYRHLALVSLNEVGDSPQDGVTRIARFHAANRERLQRWPESMLATSTHDAKRSEDVRCRIDLLSEIPDDWRETVMMWTAHNARHRRGSALDVAAEYLLYQTLVGIHPIETDRLCAYMEKATREAKRQTSWLEPDPAYDQTLRDFVTAVNDDQQFRALLDAFVMPLLPWARINSLAMTLLKLCSPGIPDIYQGCELWDESLVDPDNRRPVDFELRTTLLEESRALSPHRAWRERRETGLPKLLLIDRVLQLRARRPEIFTGDYLPLGATGPAADHLVAFARGAGADVVVAVPRCLMSIGGRWETTALPLAAGAAYRNIFDDRGELHRDSLLGTDLFANFPVALLVRTENPRSR